jgi:hypothetical protein
MGLIGGPWNPPTRIRLTRITIANLSGNYSILQLRKNDSGWINLLPSPGDGPTTWIVQVDQLYADHGEIITLEIEGDATGTTIDLEYYPSTTTPSV